MTVGDCVQGRKLTFAVINAHFIKINVVYYVRPIESNFNKVQSIEGNQL